MAQYTSKLSEVLFVQIKHFTNIVLVLAVSFELVWQ